MDVKYAHLKLSRLPGEFKFLGFSTPGAFEAAVKSILNDGLMNHCFIFRSPGDDSIIVPDSMKIVADSEESGWIGIITVGPMPFGTVQGLIATISSALMEQGIGVCVISSYKCDFFLIRASKYEVAERTLKQKGWTFTL